MGGGTLLVLFYATQGGSAAPADFLAALIAAAKADSNLSAFNGQFWDDEAPSNATAPYVVITLSGGSDVVITDETRIYDQSLRFRVYGPDATTASTQGNLLADRFKAWGSLDFVDGFSIAMVERGRRPAVKAKALGPTVKPRYFFEVTASARVHQGR